MTYQMRQKYLKKAKEQKLRMLAILDLYNKPINLRDEIAEKITRKLFYSIGYQPVPGHPEKGFEWVNHKDGGSINREHALDYIVKNHFYEGLNALRE